MSDGETAGRVLSREEHRLLYSSRPTQLNATWRLAITNTTGQLRSRAWMLQQRADDGEWRDRYMACTASAVLDLVRAKCGPIDAAAADHLNALPKVGSAAPRRREPRT
jgi:hypothetical protein